MSNPEDQDSLFFSSKTCFRALAVAVALSNDEWLRLFTPCCLLLPRNLRLQETGRSPARILQVLFDAVSCWRYFTSSAGQDREWKKTKEKMAASPAHEERAIFTILGFRSGYRRASSRVSLRSLESLVAVKKPRKTKDQLREWKNKRKAAKKERGRGRWMTKK